MRFENSNFQTAQLYKQELKFFIVFRKFSPTFCRKSEKLQITKNNMFYSYNNNNNTHSHVIIKKVFI